MVDPKIKYQNELTVDSKFTNKCGDVTIPYIYRIIQETASLQLCTFYDSLEYLKNIGNAYVILRMSIKLNKSIYNGEKISVSTWERSKGAVKMYRNYRIDNTKGEKAAEASSLWTFLDLKTRRPLPTKNIPNPVIDYEEDVSADSSKKLSKDENGALLGKKTVIDCDIDLYGHMNNTKYVDLVFSYLPENIECIKEFTIEFISECMLGDELDIFFSENKGVYRISGVRTDGTLSFTSEIITEV